MSSIEQVLNETFKLPEFRPLQKQIIDHSISGGSGLVIMPTGSGKSLTYQLPSVMLEGTTLVVSPLKALMKDQVDKLRALGLRASLINSDVQKPEREKRQKQMQEGHWQILYVTPERFRKAEFLAAIEGGKAKISRLVIDEAHCISQWGQDFRPEYARVGLIRERLGNPPTLALTATATTEVKADILKQLNLQTAPTYSLPIARPNLAIEVDDVSGLEDKISKTAELLKNEAGSVIIYFSLITTLHKFSDGLQKQKIQHAIYHGDLNERLKRSAQERFLEGKERVMLATPAFGLGIDKSNVRAVLHIELPGSIEAYFQEIGRGGRDGGLAKCVLFYDEDDVSTQMEFIEWSNPDGEYIRRIINLIEANSARFRQEGADYLREQMSFKNNRDYRVETALNLLTSWGVLVDGAIATEGLSDNILESLTDESRTFRKRKQQEKLLRLVQMISSRKCRQQYIYEYFGENDHPACGLCDNDKSANE